MPAEVDRPRAWGDLIEALTLLAKGGSDDVSPLHCEDGMLTVMADPEAFTATEVTRLVELGFDPGPDAGTFTSFRYGSA